VIRAARIGWQVAITSAAVSLLLVTCASSSGASTDRQSSLQKSSLKGAPVKVGYVDVEAGEGVTFAPQRIEAQQLVSYLNTKGGIGGHAIDLITCSTAVSSGGADCANKFVQDKTVLVLGNSVIDSAAMYPILKSAGIPFFGGGASPLNAADLTPDGNHWFTAGGILVGYLQSNAFIATTLKAKSLGVIVGSAGVAQQAASQFIQKPLEADHVTVQSVTVNESNPDYTSAVDSIMSTKALEVLESCELQDSAIKQARTLGYKGAAIGCNSASDLKALGSASKGLYAGAGAVVPALPTASTQAEINQYVSLAHHYHWDLGQLDVGTYEQVYAGVAFIKNAGGASATGLEIRKTISTTTDLSVPMAPPAGLTCSKVLSPYAATACNVQGRFIQMTNSHGGQRWASKWLVPPAS
jgi:branched-chain amino acid transport system substrate-binding protein